MRYLIVLLALAACRQEPIREIVNTGERTLPDRPDVGVATPTITVDAGQLSERFTKAALLREIAECALPLLADFDGNARALADATSLHASSPSPDTERAARDAWRAAMAVFQELEVFRLGPAAASSTPGGRDLRDQIYPWPLVSACKIDEQIVARTYAEPGFSTSLINGRGLGAIERLLFFDGAANACSQFSTINASGSWDAMSADDRAQRRRDYAAAVARDVATRSALLRSAGTDYFGQLPHATLFMSEQHALNRASDALFYLEKEVKDLKLARPMGLQDCDAPPCGALVESPWAHASTDHLRANLRGFRRIFSGCGSGIGFDDWLDAAGASELSGRMTSALAQAIHTADALDQPIEALLLSDPARVTALYSAVKAVTDPLKTELTSVLDLELPMTVEGDND